MKDFLVFMVVMLFFVPVFGQFVMTPERQAAMKASAQQIFTYAKRTKQNNDQITGLQQSNGRIEHEKAVFIEAEKKRLGLPATASWDDTKGWVIK